MRKHLIWLLPLLALFFVLSASGNANAFILSGWYNIPPTALADEMGVPLPQGTGLIQLIYAGPNNTIDDPMELLTCPEKEDWLSAGCLPVGDDVLVGTSPVVNPTNINVAVDGYFAEYGFVVTTPVLEGEYLYTRFFTTRAGPLPQLGIDWYGDTGLWCVPPGGGEYIIDGLSPPYKAHTKIVPEPSILLLLSGSLIFLLLKLGRK